MSAAAKQIESTRNLFDDPNDPAAIALNASTYTPGFAANKDRIGWTVSNDSNKGVWAKSRAFDDPDDNVIRGQWIPARSYYETPSGRDATSPISFIADSGTPSIVIQEF